MKRFLVIGLLTATLGGGMIVSANAGHSSGCSGADCQSTANSCSVDCRQDCVSWCQTEGCDLVSDCTNSCIEENCTGCDLGCSVGEEPEKKKRILIEGLDYEIVRQPYDIVKDKNDASKYTVSSEIKFLKDFKKLYIEYEFSYVDVNASAGGNADGNIVIKTYGYELESVQKYAEGVPGTITMYFSDTYDVTEYTITLKEIHAFDVDA